MTTCLRNTFVESIKATAFNLLVIVGIRFHLYLFRDYTQSTTLKVLVGRGHFCGAQLQNVACFQFPILHIFGNAAPEFAVSRFEADTFLFHLRLLLFGAMEQFKFVERRPTISNIGFQFNRSNEPFACFVNATFGPEQFGHGGENVRVVLALLQGIDTLRFTLRS